LLAFRSFDLRFDEETVVSSAPDAIAGHAALKLRRRASNLKAIINGFVRSLYVPPVAVIFSLIVCNRSSANPSCARAARPFMIFRS